MIKRALDALDLGFPTFPLHGIWDDASGALRCTCGNPACGRNAGKHPATHNGLRDATRDTDLITHWWEARPGNNIGGRTGERVVLDIDLDKAGDRSLNDLEAKHGRLPKTWISKTGNGFHAVFAPPAGAPIACSTGKIGSGLDIKASGGYIVMPGSRHYSGRTYDWHPEYHPSFTPLAVVPDWLASLCREVRTAGTAASRSSDELARLVNGKVGEGMRNDTLQN